MTWINALAMDRGMLGELSVGSEGVQTMLFSRNGMAPRVHAEAIVAETASIVGDVTLAAGCYVDYGAVIESSGPPIILDEGVIVMANAVVRSLGGPAGRQPASVRIGAGSIIGPQAALAGCEVGEYCYIATRAVVLQGARIGRGSRLAVGSIAHAGCDLPPGSRVGLNCIAVPGDHGVLVTADDNLAWPAIARADFFRRAFGISDRDQETLHREAAAKLRAESQAWRDKPAAQ
jgi:carbonic anhydrase/acetyltransferase-like protein (isoleucine patch superfamily)